MRRQKKIHASIKSQGKPSEVLDDVSPFFCTTFSQISQFFCTTSFQTSQFFRITFFQHLHEVKLRIIMRKQKKNYASIKFQKKSSELLNEASQLFCTTFPHTPQFFCMKSNRESKCPFLPAKNARTAVRCCVTLQVFAFVSDGVSHEINVLT